MTVQVRWLVEGMLGSVAAVRSACRSWSSCSTVSRQVEPFMTPTDYRRYRVCASVRRRRPPRTRSQARQLGTVSRDDTEHCFGRQFPWRSNFSDRILTDCFIGVCKLFWKWRKIIKSALFCLVITSYVETDIAFGALLFSHHEMYVQLSMEVRSTFSDNEVTIMNYSMNENGAIPT
jgi:hypothetical protein